MTDDKIKQIRKGPHPLSLHVASAVICWSGATASFPLFQLNGIQIHPDLHPRAEALQKELANFEFKELHLTIAQKSLSRLSKMFAGIRAYQEHPYQRNVTSAPLYHHIGTTKILDYGTECSKDAPIVLAIPSLINRAYILDLMENNSLMRYLSQQNIHPYLLDWTLPGPEELEFDVENYITKRLIPMIQKIHRRHNKKIHLLGYCMGGNLSLAATQLLQSENVIESLTLIATPWNFHAGQPAYLPMMTDHLLKEKPSNQNFDTMPMNIMQLFFFSLDSTLSDKKFRKFLHIETDSDKARNFVAIEDWANDNTILSPKVTNDCLINWYQQNKPYQKLWRVAGQIIDPSLITIPGHIITPKSDRIVPAASASALQKKLPHFKHTIASGGHVSAIAGENAKTILWQDIAKYLK